MWEGSFMTQLTHLVMAVALLFLAACDLPPPTAPEEEEPQGIGVIELVEGRIGGREGPGVPVSRFIWSAAVDTLSFMPLASVDPFTGVIVTEWGSANASTDERFKATVLVTSQELSANAVRVALFRQVRDADLWVDAPVEPALARQVEDAILLRARQLRIADATG